MLLKQFKSLFYYFGKIHKGKFLSKKKKKPANNIEQ